jgi:hypothetical protein
MDRPVASGINAYLRVVNNEYSATDFIAALVV